MSDTYRDKQGVFRNKLGITDSTQLEKIEYEITSQRASEWESLAHHQAKEFGLVHQKAIHKHLFGDVYEWAGEIRTVPSRKTNPHTGGVSQFADPENIEQDWQVLDKKIALYLQNDKSQGPENKSELANIFVEANRIHPFPEGNGRSLQVFMRDLAREQGFELDYSQVSKNEWNKASALSGTHGRLFERRHFIAMPSDDRSIKEIFNRIASPSHELATNRDLFVSRDTESNPKR